MQRRGALVGLRETRRPFVSSAEVGSARRLQRSVGVRLLFYLSMRDLATGHRLQATKPSQVHCCLFPLQQLLAPRRGGGSGSPYDSQKVRFVDRVQQNHRSPWERKVSQNMLFFPPLASAQAKMAPFGFLGGHWQGCIARFFK